MYGKPIDTEDCYWKDIFDIKARQSLITGWVIIGRIGFFLVLWLNLNLWFTALRNDLKYRNLAVFTTALSIRRGYSYIIYFLRYMNYDVLFNINNCNTYGFLDTFLGVFEVESLTHVCIERYVVAKYIANGWPIQRWHYILYPCLCLFFSLLYSLSPLFGFGSYVKDFSCQTCAYDMVLPDSWERYVVITIYFLRSIKPFLFMMIMRIWTQQMEEKFSDRTTHWKEIRFAHLVDIITTASILCWLPITAIRAVVIFWVNYSSVELKLEPYIKLMQWAIWLEWFTPGVVTCTLVYYDGFLRSKMFGTNKKEKEVVKVYEGKTK